MGGGGDAAKAKKTHDGGGAEEPKESPPIEGGSDICNVRESNPGLYRGRVVFYH